MVADTEAECEFGEPGAYKEGMKAFWNSKLTHSQIPVEHWGLYVCALLSFPGFHQAGLPWSFHFGLPQFW